MQNWGLTDMKQHLAEVEALADSVNKQAAVLKEHQAAWAESRLSQKTDKLCTGKRVSMQFRKDTGQYRATVPSKVLHWLTALDFWAEGNRSSVHQDAVMKDDTEDMWSPETPCLWQESDEGPQRWWGELTTCWGKRLERQQRVLVAALAKRPDLSGKAMMQTKPLESRAESYLDEAWVPEHFKVPGLKPAGLGSFGAPWQLYENSHVWRGDCVDVPLPGIGQVWIQEEGTRLLLLWPVSACISKGCAAADAWDWLFGDHDMSLSPQSFQQWATTHLSWMVLYPHDAAWVPWGYQTACVNLTTEKCGTGPSMAIVQPFFSRGLAQKCATLADVGGHLMGESQRCKDHGDKTWTLIAGRLHDWLKGEVQEAKRNGTKGADVLVAIGDVTVARTRTLRRGHTLDGAACIEDTETGPPAARTLKRARTASASQALEGGAAAAGPGLLALADGDACSQTQEREENKAEDVEQLQTEPTATTTEAPAIAAEAVAAQVAPGPSEGQAQQHEPGTGDASELGA